jgi:HEAT repeat protein
LEVLGKLRGLPEAEVVAAMGTALSSEKSARRRAELVEALRDFPSPEPAALVVKMLGDASPEVRGNAIHTLRLFARKVDRVGGKREERAAWARPKVEGLVPELIKAADDAAEGNRTNCLYALADSLDSAAIERVRAALKDTSERVRMTAACLLSEFGDASGMGELKSALKRVRATPANDPMRWFDAERVIASMERLTGKSFGRAPPNPLILSDTRRIAEAEREYERILGAWAAWWEWEPAR